MSKTDKIPSHVAIIMDGNGRWARARGLGETYFFDKPAKYILLRHVKE